MPRLSTATDSESFSHVGLLGGQLCAPPAVVTGEIAAPHLQDVRSYHRAAFKNGACR